MLRKYFREVKLFFHTGGAGWEGVKGLLKNRDFLRWIKIQLRSGKDVAMVTISYFCILHDFLILVTHLNRKDVLPRALIVQYSFNANQKAYYHCEKWIYWICTRCNPSRGAKLIWRTNTCWSNIPLCWHQSSGGTKCTLSAGLGRFGFLRVKEQSLPGGGGHILMWNVATVLKIIIAVALSSSSCTVCSANQQWDEKIATKMSLASRLLAHRLVVAFERASRRLGKPSLLLSRWAHGCKDKETVWFLFQGERWYHGLLHIQYLATYLWLLTIVNFGFW